MKIQAVKGTADILPEEIGLWHFVETRTRDLFERYGFKEIRTPIFEKTELFVRSVGEGTDIVSKEMYTFEDKGDKSLTLRPELTASIVRAYLQHGYAANDPFQKLYYIGPMFRRERPQAGRQRQFHQNGVEILGGKSPGLDAEVITLAYRFFELLGLEDVNIVLNSVGYPEKRKEYINSLRAYLTEQKKKLCQDCHTRIEKNVMRVLDCKVKECQPVIEKAPQILDFIDSESKEHFEQVRVCLDMLKIPYTVNPRLVRGLDYYTRTVFEISHASLGAQDAIGAGGRYDNLIGSMGGPKELGATGFALGIERILMALKNKKLQVEPKIEPLIYFVSLGEVAWKENFKWLYQLRDKGIYAEMEMGNKSLKSQMRSADKSGAQYAVVLGSNEIKEGKVPLKNLKNGEEKKIEIKNLINELIKMRN